MGNHSLRKSWYVTVLQALPCIEPTIKYSVFERSRQHSKLAACSSAGRNIFGTSPPCRYLPHVQASVLSDLPEDGLCITMCQGPTSLKSKLRLDASMSLSKLQTALGVFSDRAFYTRRQNASDSSPTSYGNIETVGTTSPDTKGSSGGYLDNADDDDSDRPLPDQNTREQVGEKFDELKDDIQSATGDLEEDLGKLNVEVPSVEA